MKHLLITLSIVMISLTIYSQNQYHISQFMMHQPFVNPAAQASYHGLNGALFYKTQWTGFVGAPEITGFNVNSTLGKLEKNSLGLSVVKDQIGLNNNFDVSANYAYKMKVGQRSYLAMGLGVSLMMMQSNLADAHTIQDGDPVYSGNTETFLMPNFKFGAYFFKDKFYAGVTSPNLLKNRITYGTQLEGTTEFDASNIHLYVHAGRQFEINKEFDLNTSLMVKHVSGAPVQVGINAQVVYNKRVGLGVAYRTSREISGLLSYQIIPELKLGYAYDLNLDLIGNYSNGTHEVMLIYTLVGDKKIPIVEVPRF